MVLSIHYPSQIAATKTFLASGKFCSLCISNSFFLHKPLVLKVYPSRIFHIPNRSYNLATVVPVLRILMTAVSWYANWLRSVRCILLFFNSSLHCCCQIRFSFQKFIFMTPLGLDFCVTFIIFPATRIIFPHPS